MTRSDYQRYWERQKRIQRIEQLAAWVWLVLGSVGLCTVGYLGLVFLLSFGGGQ